MTTFQWFSFNVWVPGDDEGTPEGYEYTEEEEGTTLEDAKERYRQLNPGIVVLAGGDPKGITYGEDA